MSKKLSFNTRLAPKKPTLVFLGKDTGSYTNSQAFSELKQTNPEIPKCTYLFANHPPLVSEVNRTVSKKIDIRLPRHDIKGTDHLPGITQASETRRVIKDMKRV